MKSNQGFILNKKWNVNAKHALYRSDGTWYHVLVDFPGAYFDDHGYLLFNTEEEYRSSKYFNVTKEVGISRGISKIPGYVRIIPDNSDFLQNELLLAIHQEVDSGGSPVFTKQQLIDKGLDIFVPDSTKKQFMSEEILSSTLNEVKYRKIIAPLANNFYLLIDRPVDVDKSDLSDEAIDVAITLHKLTIGNVPTSDEQVLTRRRHGQSRLRMLTLNNYGHRCAFCDVDDDSLLVASHVVRWADDPIARGDLSNIICLCRFHDPLFEQGYICLTDDCQIETISSSNKTVSTNLALITGFRSPKQFPPLPEYLRRHRQRNRQNAT